MYIDIGEIIERQTAAKSKESNELERGNSTVSTENLSDQDICDDEEPIHLPPHMRCSCHTLNIIATSDVEKISNRSFSKLK